MTANSHDQPSDEVAAAQTERLESTQNGHSSLLMRTSVIGSQSSHSMAAISRSVDSQDRKLSQQGIRQSSRDVRHGS